jgi:DNA-binding beta-propeller fold protein YncE
VAGSGGQHTSPDLTAAHWQQGDQGAGYGQYGGGQGGGGRRPWWRSPFTLAAAVVVLLGGGGGAYYAASHKSGKNNTPPVVSLNVVKPPGCSTAAVVGKNLSAKTQQVPVSSGNGYPFSVVPSGDGKAVFVITDTALKVYKTGPGGTLTPAGWQYPVGGNPGVATSAALTPDGKYVLVAANNGIQVLDASGAESGASSINVGQLTVPGLSKDSRPIGVAVTPNGNFAFVSLQFANKVGVFNLGQALSTHDWSSDYLGSLNVGTQPVGLTVSPDGQTLYATNFVQDSPVPGQLSVIDVAKATTKGQQKSAIVSQVQAGCHPARVVLTSDGKTAWVTSRQSNVVLGYSTSLLRTDPAKALRAKVPVGQWPIGIALVNNESRLVISDNDGNDSSPTSTSAAHNLAVLDPGAALKGKPALLGYIPTGDTPRDIEVSPNGKFLYVIDRDSAQIQVVNLSTLP